MGIPSWRFFCLSRQASAGKTKQEKNTNRIPHMQNACNSDIIDVKNIDVQSSEKAFRPESIASWWIAVAVQTLANARIQAAFPTQECGANLPLKILCGSFSTWRLPILPLLSTVALRFLVIVAILRFLVSHCTHQCAKELMGIMLPRPRPGH